MCTAANLKVVWATFFFFETGRKLLFLYAASQKNVSGFVSSTAYKYYIMVISNHLSELQTTLAVNWGY